MILSMRWTSLNSSTINWDSPLSSLVKGRKSKTIEKLTKADFRSLNDLLWIIPLRTQISPTVRKLQYASTGDLFKGVGKVISIKDQPNFKVKGKGKTPLTNITLIAQDRFSSSTISLKWFNLYPSQVMKVKEHKYIFFHGQVSEFMSSHQMIAPDIIDLTKEEYDRDQDHWNNKQEESIHVSYPTIDGISPSHLLGLFNKIPEELWNKIPDTLPEDLILQKSLMPLHEAFKVIHGRCLPNQLTEKNKDTALRRLIYQEFLTEQLKILVRKDILKKREAITLKDANYQSFLGLFPYQLTDDQKTSLEEVVKDIKSQSPMMRLIQGDVGSGKTTIALISAMIMAKEDYQTAIMCPTESLALQHFLTAKEILKEEINCDILVGSLSKKEKEEALLKLRENNTKLIIGTHALIQDSVEFRKLGLAIIDEQHKFGVKQRVKLTQKGKGVHSLLMTATPIPRSLSLTQYGDLDVSVIKTMPSNRKAIHTRIVTYDTYPKYLSFLKTRISMGEQAYIVVPAIEDNPEQDMLNLEVVLKKYCEYFPEAKISGLHGKMKTEEKNEAFYQFRDKSIDMLISTSVIEVGINNPNATVMAILSPERFGLSSLHQLRGRVGRGEKPGFCFLVNDKKTSLDSMNRLKVIESSTDGFYIAEQDLQIRGEGDLFGKEQSGIKSSKVLASLIEHQDILLSAKEDALKIKECYQQIYGHYVDKVAQDDILLTSV